MPRPAAQCDYSTKGKRPKQWLQGDQMLMYSVYKIFPRGQAEFVSDAGSLSSATLLASEHSSMKPFHCVIRASPSEEARHFRNGRVSDN